MVIKKVRTDAELMALPHAGLTKEESERRWLALRRKWRDEEREDPEECEFCGSTDLSDYEDCDHECSGTRADDAENKWIEDDHR